MFKNNYLFILFTVSIFIPFSLSAQKDSLRILKDTVTLSEVEIEAQKSVDNPLGKTLSYTQLDQGFLLKNQGNTFINTLEKLPGISSINTGVGISKPVIRGMSFNRVIVNEYGIKQEGQQWGVDHGLEIDQYNVDQVEIIKGPVSLLYGSDGIGGVINILKPRIKAGNYFNPEVLLNYRSGNDTYGGSLLLETAHNSMFARGRVTWQEYGDYRVPATEFDYNSYRLPIYNNRLKNTAGKELNFSLLTGIRKKWGITSLYFSKYGQRVGFFSGAFGIPRAYQLTDDGNIRDINLPYQDIQHIKVISNTKLFIRKTESDLDIGYQQNIREEHSPPHYHGYGPVPQGSLALKLILRTYSLSLKFATPASDRLNFSYGLSGQIQKNERDGYEFLIPEYTTAQAGIFVLEEYKITPRLLWTSGIRADWTKQNIQKSLLPQYDATSLIIGYTQRSPAIDRDYLNLSGATGILFRINERTEIKYNIGSAFRVPTAAELTSNGVHHGTFRHEMGDSTLTAERGYMQDIILNIKKRKLDFSISPFLYYFSNYIYLSPSARFSPLADAGQVYRYTEAPVWINGIESSLSLKIGKRWNLLNALEYVWNKNIETSYPLPFTPPFSALGELEYKVVSSGKIKETRLAFAGQYFAAQNRVDRNEKVTPGYFLINLNYSMDFFIGKQKLSIIMIGRNLTNQKYLNNMSRYRILNLPEQGVNLSCIIRLAI